MIKTEYLVKFRARLSAEGIDTQDLPPLEHPIDLLMLLAIFTSSSIPWRQGLRENPLFRFMTDYYWRECRGRLPFGRVVYAALVVTAGSNPKLLGLAGLVREIRKPGGDATAGFDGCELERAYEVWCRTVLSPSLNSGANFNSPRIRNMATWLDRWQPLWILLNPRDFRFADGSLRPQPADVSKHHVKMVLKCLRTIAPGIDMDYLKGDITKETVTAVALEMEIDGVDDVLYLDLKDGSCHLDYFGIARRIARELSIPTRDAPAVTPISALPSDAVERKMDFEASPSPDPVELLTYADEVAYRDELMAHESDAYQAELAWRRRNAEGERVTRKAIAEELGVSVRSMRHAGETIDEQERRFRDAAE